MKFRILNSSNTIFVPEMLVGWWIFSTWTMVPQYAHGRWWRYSTEFRSESEARECIEFFKVNMDSYKNRDSIQIIEVS